MVKYVNMVGLKSGRWEVISSAQSMKVGAHWLCRCECGTEKVIAGSDLRAKKTLSCGCLRNEMNKDRLTRHGLSRHPLYHIWNGIISRCTYPRNESYSDYGGRGIKVCDRWLKVENFIADMGDRPSDKHSIERIDSDGDYEPENCKWALIEEQNRNRKVDKRNKSGYKGVLWIEERKKWLVYINRKSIGYYSTLEEAIEARKQAELKYWSST